jgi:hypothetical protein
MKFTCRKNGLTMTTVRIEFDVDRQSIAHAYALDAIGDTTPTVEHLTLLTRRSLANRGLDMRDYAPDTEAYEPNKYTYHYEEAMKVLRKMTS